jgi:hypothetical protein
MITFMETFALKNLTPITFAFKTLFTLFIFSLCLSALAQSCQDAATITPTATAKAFTSTTSMKTCYVPGASDTVSFTITPNKEANLEAPRAVVVFDIVGADDNASPSRIMQVIDVYSLTVTPDIFRDSLEMSVVQAGLKGDISFKMRDNAPAGNYTMVISVFRLAEGLRPRDVTYDPNALAGRVFYSFRIEK